VEELCLHLQGIGVKASVEGTVEEKQGQKRSWGQRLAGTIKLVDRNVDSIDIVGASSQYGTNYHLDYLVKRSNSMGREKKRKIKLARKKKPALWGKVVDVEWKGSDSLAQRLNLDYQLKDKLLQATSAAGSGGISIHDEPKRDCARIRTGYFLPSPGFFEVVDIIARHVRSWQ